MTAVVLSPSSNILRPSKKSLFRLGYESQCHIQNVSRLVDITTGRDFLGSCDKKVPTNMCPILDGYGVMTV
jgi:hypothetical protein